MSGNHNAQSGEAGRMEGRLPCPPGNAAELDHRIEPTRQKNEQQLEVPNRTKVVRLFVVADGLDPTVEHDVRHYALAHHATRADVFHVRYRGEWGTYSWSGGPLLGHAEAHAAHAETIPIVMIRDREQLQWECEYPFRIREISVIDEAVEAFPNCGRAPLMPFRADLVGAVGGLGRPVRSGPAAMMPGQPYNQMYKASFDVLLPGYGSIVIDPDFYCDWD